MAALIAALLAAGLARADVRLVPPPLVLEAAAEPKVARPGQPVSVRVKWKHRAAKGESALRINRRGLLGREIVIVVTRAGKPVALKVPPDLGPPEKHDFMLLAPGAHLDYDYPLEPEAGGTFPPGSYQIRVVYRNDFPGDAPPAAWIGILETKTKLRVLKKD